MKKFLITVVFFTGILVFIGGGTADTWDGTIAASFDGGSGTDEDPFIIANCSQLAYLAQEVNKGNETCISACYTLTSSLDLANLVWTPIGNMEQVFKGTFEGQGNTISHLFTSNSSASMVGLFGSADNASIANVSLNNVDISGDFGVGGLIGVSFACEIRNCSFSGNVSGSMIVGGLLGMYSGNVSNCSSNGTIFSLGYGGIGGLIGCGMGCNISSSFSTAGIIGNDFLSNTLGGLMGSGNGCNVSNCYATGDIKGNSTSSESVGGLIGGISFDVNVIDSYATGNVSGNKSVGGLIGLMSLYVNVIDSYATGNVSGNECVGGLIGNQIGGNTNTSYAFGEVSGGNDTGGLIGFLDGDANNCFATGKVNGNDYVGGLAGCLEYGRHVINSYAVGRVDGNMSVGGLFGEMRSDTDLSDSFALNEYINGLACKNRVVGNISEGTVISNVYAWNGMKVNGMLVSEDEMNGMNATCSDVWTNLIFWQSVFGSDNISFPDGHKLWSIVSSEMGNNVLWGIPYLTDSGIPPKEEAKNIQYLKPNKTLIILNKDGGIGGTNETNATVGSNVLDPAIQNPSRHDYVLCGWYDNETEGVRVITTRGELVPGTVYTDDYGNWRDSESTLNLYARWIQNPQHNIYIYDGVTNHVLEDIGDRVNSTEGNGYAELTKNESTGYELLFNNFTINDAAYNSSLFSLIWSKNPLTIHLVGDSHISVDPQYFVAILSQADMKIQGLGNLTISGPYFGLVAQKIIEIKEVGKVNIKSTESSMGIFQSSFTPNVIKINEPLHVFNGTNKSDPLFTFWSDVKMVRFMEIDVNASIYTNIEVNQDTINPNVPIEPNEEYKLDDISELPEVTAEFESGNITGTLNVSPVDISIKEELKDNPVKDYVCDNILTSFTITSDQSGAFNIILSGITKEDADKIVAYHKKSNNKWEIDNNPMITYKDGNYIFTFSFDSFSPVIISTSHYNPGPIPHPGHHDAEGSTIITSQTPIPTVIPTVSPTNYPIQPTGVNPSAVPTVPATQQSPIPFIGILSGFAIGGFLLTRLRK